jgi:hypothetical protein
MSDYQLPIANWRLAIGDWRLPSSLVANEISPPRGSRWAIRLPIGLFRYELIGNRQSQIGNRMARPDTAW